MIFTWMLYCTLVAALLGLGAAALERALGALGGATRGAWAAAIVLSAAFPVALPRLMELRAAPVAPAAAAGAVSGPGALRIEAPAVASGPTALQAADLLLLPAWGLASAGLVLAGCALLLVLRVRRRGWRRAVVAGEAVLVSAATGPAVVGFVRGSIVLPEWALGWDEERQRMMVEHEREHLRARDPLLFLLALACAAAVPWNAALWWQLRRLRLAMEVDCDARVLRRRPDVRAYGLLLLEVGRLASSGRAPLLALTEPPSFLERRIRTMTSRTPERSFRRAVLPAAVCAGALVLAAALPAPRSGIPGRDVTFGIDRQLAADTVPGVPSLVPPAAPDDLASSDQWIVALSSMERVPNLRNLPEVQRLIEAGYPPALRDSGVTGMATVTFVVGADGAARDVRLVEATGEAFGEPALAAVRAMRFTPGELVGSAATVRVRLPESFPPPRDP